MERAERALREEVTRKNPLAELLGRLLRGPDAGRVEGVEIVVRHRGAPGDEAVIPAEAIASATSRSIELADGTPLPLHRVLEVRRDGVAIWRRGSRGA